jgi:predicted homoserine dehydrogenase-like protein
VRIGLIGAGEMGTDIVTQVEHMPGLQVTVLAEIAIDKARQAIGVAGLDEAAAAVCEDAGAIERATAQGRIALTPDAALLCRSPAVDVVIDASGKPAVGAEFGMLAMAEGKHLVMMNVEADVTIGALLRQEAERHGVIYTLGAGDEPSAAMELINFVSAMGYPIVAAGKGKNNPLVPTAVPRDYEAEAHERNMNPRMLVEFVDGTKTMVEMAAIANATGLVPDIPGMHGPGASREDLSAVFCPTGDGGVLSRKGVVDFSVGKGVAPGVFVVAEMAHPRVRERMHDLKLGAGPYYTFYRPYHLTSLEVPLTAARAVLYGTGDMAPLPCPTAEVAARAKRALAPGERLDAIGETGYRGWIMTRGDCRAQRGVPIGLLEGAQVTAPIKAGDLLTEANVQVDPSARIVALRRQHDEAIAKLESVPS